jgi:bacillopeptidase F (M6 metalloprotease family)
VNGDDVTVTPSTQTTTKTIVGVYPVYSNKGTHVANSTTFEITFDAESTAGYVWFEYPSDRDVTVYVWNDNANKYDAYPSGSGQSTEATSRTVNGVTYNKWTRAGNMYTEAAKVKFVLSKSTNA